MLHIYVQSMREHLKTIQFYIWKNIIMYTILPNVNNKQKTHTEQQMF